MPYANSQGVRIYYEVEGEGAPLVLAHGLTGSVNGWWRFGYADTLRNDFQLIAFDARGHGQSDKPHEPAAYGTKMASDVVAVLDHIGIGEAHYFGYSMGARIGFRVATRHSDRFRSFILGGASPYRSEAEIKVEKELMEGMKMLLNDPEAALLRREQMMGRPLTSEERDAVLANDAEALIAVVTSIRDMPPLTDHELSLISVPSLLFCGDLDPRHSGVKESVNHIPKATFISLPGLDHAALGRSDLVLPHIKEFLARVI
jgi:pimeloyl-ACP methyl ester carboxylesterase